MKIITITNIKYQLDTEDKTAIVIGYQDYPVDVIIPEYVEYKNEKYKVTKIRYYALSCCNSLTSITIPNSVTSIGNNAFYYCISLETITIPDSVTYIGYEAFYNCKNLKSVTIGNSVTHIIKCTFQFCSSLTSITIGNSVTKIGDTAFYGCKNLTSITIPDSVTKIGDSAFYNCENLTSITIPNSVKYIGNYAFQKCSSLTTITIPNSVTYIGILAFSLCTILEFITIPDSIKYIGDSAFYNVGLTLPKRYTEDGKLITYKGFKADMTCRSFQYEEGKSYEIEGEIRLCNRGFHACTNLLDVFNYYAGQIGTEIVIHEVYLSGDIDEDNGDSKVCASKIEIGKRLTIKDINDIINSK